MDQPPVAGVFATTEHSRALGERSAARRASRLRARAECVLPNGDESSPQRLAAPGPPRGERLALSPAPVPVSHRASRASPPAWLPAARNEWLLMAVTALEIVRRQLTRSTHRIFSLPVLVLMPHSGCNCRCVMCDIWKANSDRRLLTEDDV